MRANTGSGFGASRSTPPARRVRRRTRRPETRAISPDPALQQPLQDRLPPAEGESVGGKARWRHASFPGTPLPSSAKSRSRTGERAGALLSRQCGPAVQKNGGRAPGSRISSDPWSEKHSWWHVIAVARRGLARPSGSSRRSVALASASPRARQSLSLSANAAPKGNYRRADGHEATAVAI